MTDLQLENVARVTRRSFFGSSAGGIGLTALASLMNSSSAESAEQGLTGLPHHLPKAKRVVVLWQGGGPSHVDLFDEKPMMQEMKGKDIPESVRGTTRLSDRKSTRLNSSHG